MDSEELYSEFTELKEEEISSDPESEADGSEDNLFLTQEQLLELIESISSAERLQADTAEEVDYSEVLNDINVSLSTLNDSINLLNDKCFPLLSVIVGVLIVNFVRSYTNRIRRDY